jgi:glutamate receptor, ionotropic, plant
VTLDYVSNSEKLESFKGRWKKNNIYDLWTYDTVWALAIVVEKIGPVDSSSLKVKNGENESDIFNLRISQFGPKLFRKLYNTIFEGLVREFQLIDAQLKLSALEIFNAIGSEDRIISYWTPDRGII